MSVRYTRQTKNKIGNFFHLLFFLFANAITFIVVYIFNTGRFEIVSFNFESQFVNVSLSFFSCVFKNVAVGVFLI